MEYDVRDESCCLPDKLRNLLTSDDSLADVTLECGERSFRCHRAVLAAWSDVFDAMFSHPGMLEVTTGKVRRAVKGSNLTFHARDKLCYGQD